VRLSPAYQAIIKAEAISVFGDNAAVFLFGSRVDDSKKGGDIDLFIRTADKDGLFEKKIRILARLKRQIGEQKIDVVFNEDEDRLIEQEVRKWSIPL
jgi:predicted nucleotidyltransferase